MQLRNVHKDCIFVSATASLVNNKAKNIFDQFELDRLHLLDQLSSRTEPELNRRPSPDRWSINHILIHLLTSEQLTLGYMKKKSLGVDKLKNAGPFEFFKMIVLTASQRVPLFRYNAPKHLVANTPAVLPLPTLRLQWNLSRSELSNFLENIQDKDIHKLIYKHPVAGRFDVIQSLAFMKEHFHHHLPQIKRLL